MNLAVATVWHLLFVAGCGATACYTSAPLASPYHIISASNANNEQVNMKQTSLELAMEFAHDGCLREVRDAPEVDRKLIVDVGI